MCGVVWKDYLGNSRNHSTVDYEIRRKGSSFYKFYKLKLFHSKQILKIPLYTKSNQYAANESTADLFYSSIRNYDQEEPFGE